MCVVGFCVYVLFFVSVVCGFIVYSVLKYCGKLYNIGFEFRGIGVWVGNELKEIKCKSMKKI